MFMVDVVGLHGREGHNMVGYMGHTLGLDHMFGAMDRATQKGRATW